MRLRFGPRRSLSGPVPPCPGPAPRPGLALRPTGLSSCRPPAGAVSPRFLGGPSAALDRSGWPGAGGTLSALLPPQPRPRPRRVRRRLPFPPAPPQPRALPPSRPSRPPASPWRRLPFAPSRPFPSPSLPSDPPPALAGPQVSGAWSADGAAAAGAPGPWVVVGQSRQLPQDGDGARNVPASSSPQPRTCCKFPRPGVLTFRAEKYHCIIMEGSWIWS
uniref:Basic proline-rich protein-like n=1 Tax=Phascolarctos cinereus TaxID=38626 RepID=A0A6P5K3Q4_PHACI|nr:basic proline-rich protein-like [Phascolarctos cinereus]